MGKKLVYGIMPETEPSLKNLNASIKCYKCKEYKDKFIIGVPSSFTNVSDNINPEFVAERLYCGDWDQQLDDAGFAYKEKRNFYEVKNGS